MLKSIQVCICISNRLYCFLDGELNLDGRVLANHAEGRLADYWFVIILSGLYKCHVLDYREQGLGKSQLWS